MAPLMLKKKHCIVKKWYGSKDGHQDEVKEAETL